tara:strand:- start:605 stop:1033 length:429 start_codon:yes stop_codon:yes gene_type:complete
MYVLFMRRITLLFIILLINEPSLSENHSKQEKKLFFISPNNGDKVTSPVTIKFGIKGMEIVPAGIDKPMSGHHHLLINVDELPNMNLPIPASKNYLHFGKGQKETTLELEKGKHTLQLLLGNHLHIPHKEPLISKKIEIIVK